MQRNHLVNVFAIKVRFINSAESVASEHQNSQIGQLSRYLEKLVPWIQEVFIKVKIHASRNQVRYRTRWTQLRYLLKLKCNILTFADIWSPQIRLVNTLDFNLLHASLFVCGHDQVLLFTNSFILFFLLVEIVFSFILFRYRFSKGNTANCGFPMSDETARFALARCVKWRILVEDTVEVLNAVNGSLMLTWSTIDCFQIPFDTNPDGISGLRIIDKFPHKSNRTDMLIALHKSILIQ